MHPNPAFRATPHERNLAFARERGFGTLAVSHDGRPLLSHVPFLLSEDGASADLHLVRSNPISRLGDVATVLAVSGPDAYLSPDWYGVSDQVPTWNYVAVHLSGRLVRLPDPALRDVLDRQSAAYEARLAPKPAWTMDKMSETARSRMMRMILPFRLHIERIDATWKLSQNKPDDARDGAIQGLAGSTLGFEIADMARLMDDGT
ncbi:MAG: FMN-binding negative transcriptional regulator [Pseudomonadota bacterium]